MKKEIIVGLEEFWEVAMQNGNACGEKAFKMPCRRHRFFRQAH